MFTADTCKANIKLEQEVQLGNHNLISLIAKLGLSIKIVNQSINVLANGIASAHIPALKATITEEAVGGNGGKQELVMICSFCSIKL